MSNSGKNGVLSEKRPRPVWRRRGRSQSDRCKTCWRQITETEYIVSVTDWRTT